jgi:RND family efflux transporter MFP subunit
VRWWIVGGLILACSRRQATVEPPPVLLASEDVVAAVDGTIETGPAISGELEPRRRSLSRAKIAGRIEAIGPEVGDAVARGRLLARIDAPAVDEAVASSRGAVAAARAELDVANKEVQRNVVLVEAGAVAARDLDRARSAARAARAKVQEARAQLAAARSQLADATVVAPMNGVVARRAINQGDVVTAGAELYEIIDPSSMRLEANVASEQLAHLDVAQPVVFEVRGYPRRAFRGSIERIAPAADPVTRQIAIYVRIPNPTGELVAGLFAEGRVASRLERGLVLPLSAVDRSGDQPSVLRVRGGITERVTVTLGVSDPRLEIVELTSGLSPGDVVIHNRVARDLPAGTRVELPAGAEPAARSGPQT